MRKSVSYIIKIIQQARLKSLNSKTRIIAIVDTWLEYNL